MYHYWLVVWNIFPTSLCRVLVFDSVSRLLRLLARRLESFTHHFVTHHLSHTALSPTIFHTQLCHTQLCHTPSFTHNFPRQLGTSRAFWFGIDILWDGYRRARPGGTWKYWPFLWGELNPSEFVPSDLVWSPISDRKVAAHSPKTLSDSRQDDEAQTTRGFEILEP